MELSWYGSRSVNVPLGEAFHSARLSLRSSQVGHVAGSRRERWSRSERMQLALELLRDAALDSVIGADSDFDDLPALMARLSKSGTGASCHCIRYE